MATHATPWHLDCTMVEKELFDPMIANCWIKIQQFAIIGSSSFFSIMVQSRCQGAARIVMALVASLRLCHGPHAMHEGIA